MLRPILATFPTEEIKKNPQIIRTKIPPKIKKMKKNSIQTHGCIKANQEFTSCGNHPKILPLFRGLEGSLTFSPLLSYTMKHTHAS
jgi:hypothetical protein